jgi:hypothetical protein
MGKVIRLAERGRQCPKCECVRIGNRVVYGRDYYEGETLKICHECRELAIKHLNEREIDERKCSEKEWRESEE